MANTFAFRIREDALISLFSDMNDQRKHHPGKKLYIEVRVDLFPDGIGFVADNHDISIGVEDDDDEEYDDDELEGAFPL